MMLFLIVDDESWVRDTVKTLIIRGYSSINEIEIKEAKNGIEALEYLKAYNPNVVITDMKMPGLDGKRLLEVIEKEYESLPVIVLSGYDDFVYTKQAIKAKVVEYLLKPINQIEFYQAVEKALAYEKEVGQKFPKISLLPSIDSEEVHTHIQTFYKAFYFAMKNLDIESVRNSIVNFTIFIEDAYKDNPSFVFLLQRKFVEMLEQFMQEYEFGLKDLNINRQSFNIQSIGAFDEVIKKQREIGEKVIVSMEENKKKKNRLPLEQIKSYIEKHYASKVISLEEVAKVFFVSKEYLTTVFKKDYGFNITEYIIMLRMQKAKELIIGTDMQYKIIAEKIGYEDVSYFYRVFKKFYKQSPGEMRNGN